MVVGAKHTALKPSSTSNKLKDNLTVRHFQFVCESILLFLIRGTVEHNGTVPFLFVQGSFLVRL
jgi:hypothetical protein